MTTNSHTPTEPTMAECAARLGFDSVEAMTRWALEDAGISDINNIPRHVSDSARRRLT